MLLVFLPIASLGIKRGVDPIPDRYHLIDRSGMDLSVFDPVLLLPNPFEQLHGWNFLRPGQILRLVHMLD
jgi:hypothetical protein